MTTPTGWALALADVASEPRTMSVPAELSSRTGEAAEESEDGGLPWVQLATVGVDSFLYRVHVCESPMPAYGGQNDDVMGHWTTRVIHNCLAQQSTTWRFCG